MKMRTKPINSKTTKMVKDIARANRKLYSAEEKICIVLEGLRGERSIANYVGLKALIKISIIVGRKIFIKRATAVNLFYSSQ